MTALIDTEFTGLVAKGFSGESFTGQFFDLSCIDPATINIIDIAHALALENRYGGHSRFPLSVAQHSVHVCELMRKRFPLADDAALVCALLHDAPEAYCKDLPRPLKRTLRSMTEAYDTIYDWTEQQIRVRFNVEHCTWHYWKSAVAECDNIMCRAESKLVMWSGGKKWNWGDTPEVEIEHFRPMGWTESESLFLQCWERLGRSRND